nr:hypothetical protein CFP56_21874 [Quercus suber]
MSALPQRQQRGEMALGVLRALGGLVGLRAGGGREPGLRRRVQLLLLLLLLRGTTVLDGTAAGPALGNEARLGAGPGVVEVGVEVLLDAVGEDLDGAAAVPAPLVVAGPAAGGARRGLAVVEPVEDAAPDLHRLLQLAAPADAHDADAEARADVGRALPGHARRRVAARADRGPELEPALERVPDGDDLELLVVPVAEVAGALHGGAQLVAGRVPIAHAADGHAVAAQQAHAERGRVGDDVDAGGAQLGDAEGGQQLVLDGEVGVRHDGVEGLAGLAQHAVGEGREHLERIAGDADVPDGALLVAQAPQLAHGLQDLVFGDELDVVAVDQVEVRALETVQAARHALAHPGAGVVEGVVADAADLGDEEDVVAGEVGVDEVGVEGGAEDLLGGAVVGGGVESAHAELERLLDEAGGVELVGVGVVLVVEGRGAEDEGRQDGRQRDPRGFGGHGPKCMQKSEGGCHAWPSRTAMRGKSGTISEATSARSKEEGGRDALGGCCGQDMVGGSEGRRRDARGAVVGRKRTGRRRQRSSGRSEEAKTAGVWSRYGGRREEKWERTKSVKRRRGGQRRS